MNRNPDPSEREPLAAITRLVCDAPHLSAAEPAPDETSVESKRCRNVTRLLSGETARELRERNV